MCLHHPWSVDLTPSPNNGEWYSLLERYQILLLILDLDSCLRVPASSGPCCCLRLLLVQYRRCLIYSCELDGGNTSCCYRRLNLPGYGFLLHQDHSQPANSLLVCHHFAIFLALSTFSHQASYSALLPLSASLLVQQRLCHVFLFHATNLSLSFFCLYLHDLVTLFAI